MASTVSVVTLRYEDLISFDNDPNSCLIDKIQDAFGPEGLGILAVEGIPDFQEKRDELLRLATKLPTLPDLEECIDAASSFSRGWSHGKEQLSPGVPDWHKGSYYANPLTDNLSVSLSGKDGRSDYWAAQLEKYPSFYCPNVWPASLPELKMAFTDLGRQLSEVGFCIAKVCDAYCHRHKVDTSLHEVLSTSSIATGRLLHYFETPDKATVTAKNDMWCGWHNDHSALTCLVPGAYFSSSGTGDLKPSPDATSGLYIQSRSGETVRVALSLHACGFQIGETSQILSGGLLRATPHAVKSTSSQNVTREAFAVFLGPSFETRMTCPEDMVARCIGDESRLPRTMVPLSKRWKPTQTYGEFHVSTVTAFAVN